MHEISLKACAGMENYGDSWMFFFQVWTKLSSSGDAKTHKLPTTCTLSRLLPERSRSVTSHHARNFTNCSASQFLCKSAQLLKDFSRNHPIVKPIPFPILIGVVFGNGGLTIGGFLKKSLAICQTSCELMLPSIHPNSSIRIRHSQGPTCAGLARKMQVCCR